ncbi:hypothetical protein ACJJTC_005540 [Scirpophaga incertulas]
MIYVGAALSTAARLKWDPSLYVVLREAAPAEFSAAAAALPAAALAAAALAHLALAALPPPASPAATVRSGDGAAGGGRGVRGAVVRGRVAALLASDGAERLRALLAAHDHLLAALHALAPWYALPEKLDAVIMEAEEDLPCNLHVAAGAALALVALQLAAALAALTLALATPRSAAGYDLRSTKEPRTKEPRLRLLISDAERMSANMSPGAPRRLRR